MSEYSGLERQVEEPEQKMDFSELQLLLQPADVPELDDNGLDKIVSEYKPSIPMKLLVGMLRGTSTPVDHTDYSEMKKLERIIRKYVVRPITRPKDYILTPLAGFGVRVLVGGTSGEIMTDAANYLEKELGIEETPLEYTRNNLISCLTGGLVMMLGLCGVGISLPAIVPTSAALTPILSVVNPVAYVGDMTRRLWLYFNKIPSGPWIFEGIWWAKNKVKQHIVPPLRRAYDTYVAPAVDRVKEFYTEKVRPKLETMLENFQYFDNPFNPSFHQAFPAPAECDKPDGTGTKESLIYDYTVTKDTGNPYKDS